MQSHKTAAVFLMIIALVGGVYALVKPRSNSNASNAQTVNQPVYSEQNDNSSSTAASSGADDNNSSQTATTAPAITTGAVKTVNVSGTEFAFSPSTITVNKGDTVKIVFANKGIYPHNWTVDGLNVKTSTVSPGQTTDVTFIANKTGTFQYYCSVPGHKDQGMVGQLTVK